MNPLVSIITPSYNQVKFLEQTMQSVLTQDYPNIEYIVVDGGSTDGSVDVIKRYADCLGWWVSEPDRGQTDALNKGFYHAKGEIFGWLNSDDTYLPGAIAQGVAELQAHPQASLVYGDANLIDENNNILGRFPAKQTSLKQLLRGSVHVPQQSIFYRGHLWNQVGPLDWTFHDAMDYDLWVRLAKIAPLVYVPRLWANFRLHAEGKTVSRENQCYPEMLKVYRREVGDGFSWISVRWFLRRNFYAHLPLKTRVKLHSAVNR